jgi:beta-N-acetylhexosaminidase
MNVRETISQLLMVGFQGTKLSSEFINWLQEYRPGGVILFSRNLVDMEQIAQLTNSLQELTPDLPLLIAIDQEGGRVSRLPQDFTIFPSSSTVATCQSPDVAYAVAEITAKELRAVGINMNMAPVLDVNSNPDNTIIGDRAYGNDPSQVCIFGTATMQGLKNNGIIPCGKHFPGHGDTVTDSHKVLPVVNANRERLNKIELEPFRHAIQQGLPTIMTAHVHYPALDAGTSATLSRPILTDLLREELGFQGVTITDDMEMRAILDCNTIGEASVRSLQAGANMVLICHQRERQTEAVRAIEQALDCGEIGLDILQDSVKRISFLKQKYLSSNKLIDPSQVNRTVGIPEHKTFLEKIQRA